MSWLMPDPVEAKFYGYTEDYAEYRMWWAETVMGRKIPKRRSRRGVPDPGVIPLADGENG